MSKPKQKLPTFEAECARMLRACGYEAYVVPAVGDDRKDGWVKVIRIKNKDGKTAYETVDECANILSGMVMLHRAVPLLRTID